MSIVVGPDVPKDRRKPGEISPSSDRGQGAGDGSTGAGPAPQLQFAGFVIDLQRGCLRLAEDELEIALRPKTFDLLCYLIRNPGRLLSKDELLKAVWPDVLVTEDLIVQCVTELRRALNDQSQKLIRTVPRRGYRFEATPSLLTSRSSTGASARLASSGEDETPVSSRCRGKRPTWARFHLVTPAAAICVLAALLSVWLGSRPGQDAEPPPLSLVVLPFQNWGSGQDQDYFAEGLASDLATDLSRLPGFFVIAHATARTFRGPSLDARQIGRDLDVRYVLQGSVGQSASQVRMNVQLSDVETGRVVWAERYQRERGQLPLWRNEIIGRIALALNYRLPAVESERAFRERRDSPEISDLTMRGWALVHAAKTPKNYETARMLFAEALRRDPNAVNAIAGMAWTSAVTVLDGWSASPAEDLKAAQHAVEQALTLEPNHVVAHHVRGFTLRIQRRTQSAYDAFQTVIGLNPNFAPGYAQLGVTELELGRPEATFALIERAIRLSPRDPSLGPWFGIAGIAALHLGRDKEAVNWLRRATDTGTQVALQYAYLASALALTGQAAEAQAALARFRDLKPKATITTIRGSPRSTEPGFLTQRERLYAGLRLAGLPE